MDQVPHKMEPLQQKAAQFFLENQGLVRVIALKTAPSSELLGDIVNDVFLAFVENAHRLDYQRDLRPFLKKMTHNIAMKHWRDKISHQPETIRQIMEYVHREEDTIEPDEELTLREELIILRECLGKLAPKYRELIESFYFDEKRLTEIAERFHLNPATLRKTMTRIRTSLRTCVENRHNRGKS